MAPRVKALINPAIVTWARETAGYATAAAAEKLGVDEAKLLAWEDPQGEERPSIPQLRKLATLFKRPMAAFYLREAPPRFAVMKDLRRLPGTGPRQYSPAIQLEIRAAHERRELALELLQDLDQPPPKFQLSAKITENTETVGARIRKGLGITGELQAAWRDQDGRAGFNGWRLHIERVGVLVFQTTRFRSEEASGFAVYAETLPVIAVNRNDALTRRTFSLVHEFAHLMLRVSGVSDLETDANRPPEDQKIEVFCNEAAAAALIPESTLLTNAIVHAQEIRSEKWTDGEIGELARQFNVSREAIVRRLLTFSRTTDAFYKRKREEYLAQYLAQRERQKQLSAESEIKRNMPQETISNLGRPFVRMLLGNYYEDRLTLSDVSGYLGLKVKHIPKLEKVAGLRP